MSQVRASVAGRRARGLSRGTDSWKRSATTASATQPNTTRAASAKRQPSRSVSKPPIGAAVQAITPRPLMPRDMTRAPISGV